MRINRYILVYLSKAFGQNVGFLYYAYHALILCFFLHLCFYTKYYIVSVLFFYFIRYRGYQCKPGNRLLQLLLVSYLCISICIYYMIDTYLT